MKTSGKNVTPADLPRSQREQLQHICDIHIHEILKLLKVKLVICIGKYAYERILCQRNCWFPEVQVEYIMHPSPINPKANSGWNDAVLKKLQDLNVLSYFRTD